FAGQAGAEDALAAARLAGQVDPGLQVQIVAARKHGAEVTRRAAACGESPNASGHDAAARWLSQAA
ncbi:MAG: hypothetical protein RL375_3958, partial [Pseudomonadota bacterium]